MSEDICRSCGQRPATLNWVGDGGTLAFAHGMYQRWCEHCALRAQIAFAEKAEQSLPDLRGRLAVIDAAEAEQQASRRGDGGDKPSEAAEPGKPKSSS